MMKEEKSGGREEQGKKKLLITSDCFLPRWDGVARFLNEIIPPLSEYFIITVVAPHFQGTFHEQKSVTYHRLPLRSREFGDIRFAKVDKALVRDLIKKTDIIFNQTLGPIGLATINIAHQEKKKVAHYVHSIDWELASKGIKRFQALAYSAVLFLAKQAYKKCNVLLVPSQTIEDKLVQTGIHAKKELVPLGINTLWFTPTKNRKLAKEKLGLQKDTKVLGYVGRIAREKDLPTLYRAFKTLQLDYPETKLLIVGSGILNEIPEDEDIIITGSQNDVRTYLHAMDIFVLPSLTETSSLVTKEAMSCGLPVCVTPVGNLPEYVKNGINGVLFARGDDRGLVRELKTLLRDKKLRESMGLAARETIVKEHSFEETIKGVKKALKGLI